MLASREFARSGRISIKELGLCSGYYGASVIWTGTEIQTTLFKRAGPIGANSIKLTSREVTNALRHFPGGVTDLASQMNWRGPAGVIQALTREITNNNARLPKDDMSQPRRIGPKAKASAPVVLLLFETRTISFAPARAE